MLKEERILERKNLRQVFKQARIRKLRKRKELS